MIKYALIAGAFIMALGLKKKVSINGIDFIKEVEGEKFTVYVDEAGFPTVGVGHKLTGNEGINVGDSITPIQSSKFLRQDLSRAERIVRDNVIVPLNQNQFDALVSFVFNVGEHGFLHVNNGEPSTLLRKLNEYDYQGALAEFPKWKYVTVNGQKKVSTGLINRRSYEQDLFVA